MGKPWEVDNDFIMYLNSGDGGAHPLESGVTTVRSAFRQELEIPLSLSPDWQVDTGPLPSMYYTHSFGNAVMKSPTDFHCQMGKILPDGSPIVTRFQLSRNEQFTHVGQVLEDMILRLDLHVLPTLSGGTHHYGQLHMDPPSSYYQDFALNWIIFAAIWWMAGWLITG